MQEDTKFKPDFQIGLQLNASARFPLQEFNEQRGKV